MSSDQGVSMLRNLLRNQVDIVAKGGDPVGVAFDEESAYVKFDAGQFLDDLIFAADRAPPWRSWSALR